MRIFITLSLFIGLISLLSGCLEKSAHDESHAQPNIVFIITDDQSYSAVGALGNDLIQTPNIDRLAARGTTFTHAYNMGGWNGAICTASRAMIISGRSLWRANEFRKKWIDKDEEALSQTWGRMMKEAGYQTYMTGKWHVNAPAAEVFDLALNVRPGMPGDAWEHHEMMDKIRNDVKDDESNLAEVMPLGYFRPKNEMDQSWIPYDTVHGGFWEGGLHWSEVIKNDAFQFIETAKKSSDPFFMYLAFNAPHDPRQAPKEFLDIYPIESIPLPESYLPEYPYRNEMGNDPTLRDEVLAPIPRSPYAVRKHIQEYYAIITHLDEQIGAITKKLEREGVMDNTIIFFTSDHGLSVGKHGLLGKQSMFDHSMRVPLIIAGKDIPKGGVIHNDVYLQDVMATSLELAGITRPDFLDFHSFLDLAKGMTDKHHYDGIYGAYMNLQRMIRKDGYKLILYPDIQKKLLFDLDSDPEETTNLATDQNYNRIQEKLFQDLLVLQEEFDDDLNLDSIYHR